MSEVLDRVVARADQKKPATFDELATAAGLDPRHDFVGTSLRGIDLRDEDLRRFDFSLADLTGADFRGANVADVRFNGAILRGAIGLPFRQKKVLIVEDNDLNLALMNDLLVAHGYSTLQTRDGIEALKLTRQHRPDLILMDIQLPEISGLELTKWLKEDAELQAIPIIAVTAFAMRGDEEKIRSSGCDAYIAKPISVASFLRTVERFSS